MLPKLNRRRAMFVLTKIDEILAWEKANEAERDTKFVELGRYLCEVRAGQYWRVENVKSFDEFLERRLLVPHACECMLECARKYLTRADIVREAIFRQLTKQSAREGPRVHCGTFNSERD